MKNISPIGLGPYKENQIFFLSFYFLVLYYCRYSLTVGLARVNLVRGFHWMINMHFVKILSCLQANMMRFWGKYYRGMND